MSQLVPSEYQFPSNDSLLVKTRSILFTHQLNANIISINNYGFQLITQQKVLNKLLALVSFAKPLKMAIITQINGKASIYTVKDKAEPHHIKLQRESLKSIAFSATDDFLQISYLSGTDVYTETLSYQTLKPIDYREIGYFEGTIDKQLITDVATYIISQNKVYKFTQRGIDPIGCGEDIFEGEDQKIYVYYKGAIFVETDCKRAEHPDQLLFDDWISMSKFYASNDQTQLVKFTELQLMPTCYNYNFQQYINYLVLNNTDQADYAAVFDFRTGQLLTTVQIQKGQFYSINNELLVTEMSQQVIKKVVFEKFSAENQAQYIEILKQQKYQINPNFQPLRQLIKFYSQWDKLTFNYIVETQSKPQFYFADAVEQRADKISVELRLQHCIAALITPAGKLQASQVTVDFAKVIYELNLACDRLEKLLKQTQLNESPLQSLAGVVSKLALSTAYYLLAYRNPQVLQKALMPVPLLSRNLRVVENFDFDIIELLQLSKASIALFQTGKVLRSQHSRELVLAVTQALKIVDFKGLSRFADRTFLQLIAGMDYENELVGVKRIPPKRQNQSVYDPANVLGYIQNLADKNSKKDKIIEMEFQQLMRTLWGENRLKIDTFKESIFRCQKEYLFRDVIGQETAAQLSETYPEIQVCCSFSGAHSSCAYPFKQLDGLVAHGAKISGNFLGILHDKFFNVQSLKQRFGDLSEQQIALVNEIYQKIDDFYKFYAKFHQMNIQLIKKHMMRGYEIIEGQRPFLPAEEYLQTKIYEQNAEVYLRGHTMFYDDVSLKTAEESVGNLATMKVNTDFIVQEASQYSESSKKSDTKSQKGYINKLERIAYAGRMNVVMNQGLSSLRDEFDILLLKKQYEIQNEHLDIATFLLSDMSTNVEFYKRTLSLVCAEQASCMDVLLKTKLLLLSIVGRVERVEDILINVFERIECDFSTFFQLLLIGSLKMCNFCMIHDITEDIQGFGNQKQLVIKVIDRLMKLSITFDWIWKVW